jgi:hypothetical protein
MRTVATLLVKTIGSELAIFDEASPANSQLLWDFEANQITGQEKTKILTEFKRSISSHMKSGNIVAWLLMFDGVYKTQINLLQDAEELPHPDNNAFLCTDETQIPLLRITSGKLIVASPYNLGRNLAHCCIVEPGIYKAGLRCLFEEESNHIGLTTTDEYPEGEGPDWVVFLQAVEQ